MRTLPPRLEAVLALLPPCDRLADVGTDHALVPLEAVRRGLAARAWGVDAARAPLNAAAATVAGEPRVTLVHGDGLAPVRDVRPDAVVMAGMGARTMLAVLAAGPLDGVRRLVCQPNTEVERLRAWARGAGWRLVGEAIAEDRFVTLAFAPGPDPGYDVPGFTPDELLLLGPHLVRDPAAAPFFAAQARRLAKAGRTALAEAYARAAASATINTATPRHEVQAMAVTTQIDPLAYATRVRPDFERALKEIVEIPTVSPDPAFADAIRRGANWAIDFLARHGIECKRYETAGYPVVVGWIRHPEATRTLTIYNHLDVQPATEPEWTSEPFAFVQDGDTYRGRGTTDDKGPLLAAFYSALAAREANLPLNIQFIWEFEEEIGSPNFAKFLQDHAAELRTDSVVVSDTIWIARGKPAAPLGLRGMVSFQMRLETGTKDVHSGLAGGAARNPIGELCQLIVDMYDPKTGAIKIPNIYDKVKAATPAELDGFLASGFDTAEFQRAHGLKCLRMTDPLEVTQAIWAKPTFEVHGIVGGYMGAGVKAIVPPRAEAKVSMRLVPDLQPEEVLAEVIKFVAEKNPDVVVEGGGRLEPYQGSAEGPYADAVRDSLRFAFGADPAFVREGGSIGAVVSMQRILGCPIMFIGLSLPEHGYHAPNENFDWPMAEGGMKAFMRYFEIVAAM